MKNLPIIAKLISIISVFGVFVIAVSFYVTGQMKQIDARYTALIDHKWATNAEATRAMRRFESVRGDISGMMLSSTEEGNRTNNQNLETNRKQMDGYFDASIKAALPEDADALKALKSQADDTVDKDCAPSIAAGKVETSATPAAQVTADQAMFLKDCAPKFAPIADAMSALNNKLSEAAHKENDALKVQTNGAIALTFTVIGVGLAAVIAFAFFGAKAWITTPLGALNKIMERLAGGDLQANVTGVDRKDEVGSMAKTVQVFKDAGLEKVRLEKEAADQRAAADLERARNEAERELKAKQQAFVVESIGSGLSTLADGDLIYRLTTPFSPEYEQLRGDFNNAMDKLQETMKVISANTQGILGGGEEISQAADDLSRRTEQQAASLEETAAALDQITATVRKTAEGANEASSLVGAAKADAERSGEVVQQAVTAMSAIESSSKQVSQIIGVIDEIAFQTNLLALNAGVEAARAGDAGRGFAVVASEVRALAQRSADAAKEIKGLISASSQQVNAGVGLVAETGKALERIVTQVNQINGVVTEIAASAQEQASGLHQVNTAVNQMDQVTQQNAAMVEQSTAASHALAQEAEELARLVAQFKTGVADIRASRKLAARKPAPPAPARTALKTTGHGGAAPKPALAAQDDSWEEF
jgi:methyl-accepting chemotaxis protein